MTHTICTRRTPRPLAVAALLALSVSACSSSPSETSVSDTLVEAMSEFFEESGNQVVDDVSINHDPVSGDLSLGGLEINGLEYFTGLDFAPDNINRHIATSWPILGFSIGEDPISPISGYSVGVAVMEQQSVVTNDDNRALLFDQGFEILLAEPDDRVIVKDMIEGTVDGKSRSCWWEARADIVDNLIMVFAGDGVASSYLTIRAGPDDPPVARIAADIVEAACGTRPSPPDPTPEELAALTAAEALLADGNYSQREHVELLYDQGFEPYQVQFALDELRTDYAQEAAARAADLAEDTDLECSQIRGALSSAGFALDDATFGEQSVDRC